MSAKWRVVCKHCDGTPEAHHDFEPKMPPGCVCDPFEWLAFGEDLMTPPCDSFEGEAGDTCFTCDHDRACHAKGAA